MSRKFFRSLTGSAKSSTAAAAAASVVAVADNSDLDTVSEFSCNPNNNWDILTEIDDFLGGFSNDKPLLPHMTNINRQGPTKLGQRVTNIKQEPIENDSSNQTNSKIRSNKYYTQHSKNIKVEPVSPPLRKSNQKNTNSKERLHNDTSNSSNESSNDSSYDSISMVSDKQDECDNFDSDFNNFEDYNRTQLPYRVKIENSSTEINTQNQGLNKNKQPYLNHKPLIDTNQTEVNTQYKNDQDDRLFYYTCIQKNYLETSNLPTHTLYQSDDLSYENNHRQQSDEWHHRDSCISVQQNKSLRSKFHRSREKSLSPPDNYINPPCIPPKGYNLQSNRLRKLKHAPKNTRGINKSGQYSMNRKFKDHDTGIINLLKTQSNSENLKKSNRKPFDNFRKPSIPPLSKKTNRRPFNKFQKPSIPPLSTNKLSLTSNEHYKNDKTNRDKKNEHSGSTWLRRRDQPYWEHTDAPVLPCPPVHLPLSTKSNEEPLNNFRKPYIPRSSNKPSRTSNEHNKYPKRLINQPMMNNETQNEHENSIWHQEQDQKSLLKVAKKDPLNKFQKQSISLLSTNKPSCTLNEHYKNSVHLLNQHPIDRDIPNEHKDSTCQQKREQTRWAHAEADTTVLPSPPVTNKEPFNKFQNESKSPLSTNKLSDTSNEHYKNACHMLNQHVLNNEIPIEHDDSMRQTNKKQKSKKHEQKRFSFHTESDAPVLPSVPDIPSLLTKTDEEHFNNFQKVSKFPLSTNKLSDTSNKQHDYSTHFLDKSKLNIETPNKHSGSTLRDDIEQMPFYFQTKNNVPALPCTLDVPPLATTNEEPFNNFKKPSLTHLSTKKPFCTSNEHNKYTQRSLNQPMPNNETQNEHDDSIWYQECEPHWKHTEADSLLSLSEMHYSTDMYYDSTDVNIKNGFKKSENSIAEPQDSENNSANTATTENVYNEQSLNNSDKSIQFDNSNTGQLLIRDYLSPESLSGCIIKFKPRKMINTVTRDQLHRAFKKHGPIVSSWWTPDDQYYLTYEDRSIAKQVFTVYPKNTTNSY